MVLLVGLKVVRGNSMELRQAQGRFWRTS